MWKQKKIEKRGNRERHCDLVCELWLSNKNGEPQFTYLIPFQSSSHIQNFYGFFWFFMTKLTNCRLVVFQVLRYKTVYRGSWRLNTKVAAIIGWNVSNFWRKCGKLLPSVLVFSATWGPVAMWSKNRSRVSSSENGEIRYGPLSLRITTYFWITAFKGEQGTLKITPKWMTVSRLTYFLKFGNLWSTRINAVRWSQINFFKPPLKT